MSKQDRKESKLFTDLEEQMSGMLQGLDKPTEKPVVVLTKEPTNPSLLQACINEHIYGLLNKKELDLNEISLLSILMANGKV